MNYLTTHKHRESSYLRAYKAPLHLSRNLYKSALFMQNKPNFRKAKMNINAALAKDYEYEPYLRTASKQTQSNPILSAIAFAKADAKGAPMLSCGGYFTTMAGASPKIAQGIARHSKISLTMDTYTHMNLHDHRAALQGLSNLPCLQI